MDKAYYESLEALFLELTIAVRDDFTASECCEVQEYIDVGEYGLALRTCVAIYFEEKKVASENIKFMLTRIAEKMSKDPKIILDKLNS